MKIVTKKTIKKECWNVDHSLVEWINKHFKVYYNISVANIDLGYLKFKYKGKEYTQEQIIIRIIEITDRLLEIYFEYNKEEIKLVNEMYDLLKLVHWSMCC